MTFWKTGLLALAFLSGLCRGAQICNLVFDKCPGSFTAGTLTVPQNVIWLDPVVPVCAENVQVVTGSNSAPPTLIFIIDNSGSMNSTDPEEARFRTTLNLLDSIYKAQPATKVGLVVFSRRLVFDHRDNPFFRTAFPGDTSQHDSFIPPTALDWKFPNGRTGLDTLRELLTYDNGGQLKYATKRPAVRVSSKPELNNDLANTRDGTDITLGFEAAKLALVGDGNAKENQYFIFLSDGEPSEVDVIRAGVKYDWVRGAATPTTFTVFFGSKQSAIDSIGSMTRNIQANGYSTGNDRSRQWAITLPAKDLLDLLSTSVINPIFANTPGKPVSAVMTVGGSDYNNVSVDAKSFTFPKRVPLSADQTVVNLTYTYQYTDSGRVKQKVVPYTLKVKRSGSSAPGPGLSSSCQDQGTIALFNKGNPVNIVIADHADLDIHLTLASGETCNGCKVEVKPNKSGDRENVALAPSGGFQTGNFGRETVNVPAPGDGKLQHLAADSIIVTYVNPDNPLDVIRKAFPYSDISTSLAVSRHNHYSRGAEPGEPKPGEQFVLVAPGTLNPIAEGKGRNWSLLPALATPQDSLRFVGSIVEASRAFKVEVQVFTNLGQFVNRIAFSVPLSEFAKLPKGLKPGTRQLRVLWRNRSEDGSLAGTGAYVLKTTVTLLKIPGIAEDEAIDTDYRVVGVLRSP